MKVIIPEKMAKSIENWFDDTPDRKPPEGIMKDWNTPISVQELNEETRPTERPPGYLGFVETSDDN